MTVADDRCADFQRRFTHDVGCRLPLVRRFRSVLPEAANHILDVDNGFVDECADGDRHSAERHGVDRSAKCPQREDRRGKRQRHRRQRDRGGTQIRQEQHNDHHDE